MANKTSGNGGKRGITVLSGLAAWTRGTYADFMEHDKVYLLGVPTWITSGENAGRMKIGDGVSKWSELPFQDAPIWEALGGKQDKLVGEGEGQNIKTVGGVDIMGTGDIPVGSDVDPTILRDKANKVMLPAPIQWNDGTAIPAFSPYTLMFNEKKPDFSNCQPGDYYKMDITTGMTSDLFFFAGCYTDGTKGVGIIYNGSVDSLYYDDATKTWVDDGVYYLGYYMASFGNVLTAVGTPAIPNYDFTGQTDIKIIAAIKDLSDKQDTLVGSGEDQNIKTVGGESILGTGDIPFPPAPQPVDISLKANMEIIPDIPVSILSGGELKGGLFDPTHTRPVPRYTLPPIDPDAPAYVGAVYKTDNPVSNTRIIVGQTWSVFSQAWIRGSAVMQYATDPSPSVLANTDDIVFTLDAFANFILESAYAAVNWQPSETEGPTTACLVKDLPDVDKDLQETKERLDGKQEKITSTGATNLLTAPTAAGGQPGTKPVGDLQAKLVGTGENQNIKTVGGESILGTGDIPLPQPVDISMKADKELSSDLPLAVLSGDTLKVGFYDLNETHAVPRYTLPPIDPDALAYVGAVYKLTEYPDSPTRIVVGQIWSVSLQAWFRGAATLAYASDPDPAILLDTDAADFGVTSIYSLTRESNGTVVNWQSSPQETQTFVYNVKNLTEKVDKEEGKGLSHIDVTQADKDRWDSGGGSLPAQIETKASKIGVASGYNWTSPSIPKNLLLVFAIKKIDFSYCPAGSYYSREFAPPAAGTLGGNWYAGNDGVHKGIWVQLNDSENAPAADSFSYIYDADNDTWPMGWYWPVYGDMGPLVTVGSPVFTDYNFTTNQYIRVCTAIKDLPEVYAEMVREYTYICDTDAKLANWSSNVTTDGQDYTSVLIVGNRSLSKMLTAGTEDDLKAIIDLKAIGTRRVTGMPDSVLNLTNPMNTAYTCGIKGWVTGTYPDLEDPGKNYGITGVTLNFISPGDGGTGFCNCNNMTDCTEQNTERAQATVGFRNCVGLMNCDGITSGAGTAYAFLHCSGVLYSTAHGSAMTGSGFDSCDTLINCNGWGNGDLVIISYGFYNCTGLTNCRGYGMPSGVEGTGAGFAACEKLTNCIGEAVASITAYGFTGCRQVSGCTGTGTGYNVGGYGFFGGDWITNCNGTGTGKSMGYGFREGFKLANCTGKGEATGGLGVGAGFSSCTSLTNCEANCSTSIGDTYGFSLCVDLTNCRGTAGVWNTVYTAAGFSQCSNLTNCAGIGTSSDYVGYGFWQCKRMGFNRPGDGPITSTTEIYHDCYADGGTSVRIPASGADDAAHGWNSGESILMHGRKGQELIMKNR